MNFQQVFDFFSDNFIDVEVGQQGSLGVFKFKGIYGVSTTRDLVITWNILRNLAVQVNLPWLVVGDFKLIDEELRFQINQCRAQINRF